MSQPQSSSVESTSRPAKGRWLFRGIVLSITVVVAALLVMIDGRMITSQDAGYALESATWQVEVSDLPALFRQWDRLNTNAAMRRASPALHLNVPLAICRMTGIRPTPGRARLWLGHSFYVSGGEGGWCVSVHPGIALRLVSWLGNSLKGASETDFWRNYATAWHGDYFLLASSQAYLDEVIAKGQPVKKSGAPEDTLRLSWKGDYPGMIDVAAQDQIPVLFSLKAAADPNSKLRFPAGWPDTIITVNAHRGTPLVAAAASGLAWAEGRLDPDTAQLLRRLLSAWWPVYCPLDLAGAPVDEWAAGIVSADFQGDLPVVETVWAGRLADQAVLPGLLSAGRQEHRWDEISGWLIPVAGDGRTWAAAEKEGTAFLASHETRMPALLATARRETAAGVGALNLHWKPVINALKGALLRAAKDGILPGYSEDDLQATILPCLDAFAAWGEIQLTAHAQGGQILGEGWLALGAELVP